MADTPFVPRPSLSRDVDYLSRVAKSIKAKPQIEAIQFEHLNNALSALDIHKDPYKLLSLKNLDASAAETIATQAYKKIKKIVLSSQQIELLLKLWDYLAEEDKLTAADLIVVVSSVGQHRLDKALELYRQGLAERILFTGKMAVYQNETQVSEAEYFRTKALAAGVSADNILIETESINTAENALFSARLLKKMNWQPQRIILVTLPYHLRRSYLTFRSVCDWKTQFIRASSGSKFERDKYYLDPDAWKYIFFEYIKLYGARLMKHF